MAENKEKTEYLGVRKKFEKSRKKVLTNVTGFANISKRSTRTATNSRGTGNRLEKSLKKLEKSS